MSPEQATGEALDARSDLYSLGVTALQALTGRLPFDAPNLPALIHRHVTEPVQLSARISGYMSAENSCSGVARLPGLDALYAGQFV
jgi:serine/threonine protein kinase